LNTDGTQTWLIGTATVNSDGSYSAQMIEPFGTQFGSAFDKTKINKPVDYQLHMSFACATGTASLQSNAQFFAPQLFALQRLTTPAGVPACP